MRPWMMVLALFVALGGCKKDPPAGEQPGGQGTGESGGDGTGKSGGNGTQSDGDGESAPPSHTCTTDRDCKVSCSEPDDCCGPVCRCERVILKRLADKNRQARRKNCEGKKLDCPVARCPRKDYDIVPRCVNGGCEADRVPRYRENKKYTCKSADECVVTKTMPNDCCGQRCYASAVYHQDELKAIEAVNAKRCTDADRARCVEVKCAKPAKGTVAVCEAGQCKGKLVPWTQMRGVRSR